MVGFVLSTYDGIDAIACYIFPSFVKKHGLFAFFIIAMVFNLIAFIILYVASAGGLMVPFLVCLMWGLADAIWQPQVTG